MSWFCLARLGVCRTESTQLCSSNRHARNAQKAVALMVDFVGHRSFSNWIELRLRIVCPHDSAVIVGRVVGLSCVARPIAQSSEEKAIGASNVLLMFCTSGLSF